MDVEEIGYTECLETELRHLATCFSIRRCNNGAFATSIFKTHLLEDGNPSGTPCLRKD